jgi:hypothetical protein
VEGLEADQGVSAVSSRVSNLLMTAGKNPQRWVFPHCYTGVVQEVVQEAVQKLRMCSSVQRSEDKIFADICG